MKTAKMTIKMLREFSAETPELGVSELSRRMDLDKASIFRLLRALCEEGIVEQDQVTKKYRLGLAILDLAAARLKTLGFVQLAVDEMRSLREAVGETIALQVRDGREMVCVQHSEASHPLTVRFTLGERAPVHVTASGILALAELKEAEWQALARSAADATPALGDVKLDQLAIRIEKARDDGFSIADQTYEQGVRAIAAPIRDRLGTMVGALTMVAPATRVSVSTMRDQAELMKAAAQRIGEKIPGGVDVLSSDRSEIFRA